MKITIQYDPDYDQYYADIYDAAGELIGSTMFANSRSGAKRLAHQFIFNATYIPEFVAVY